MKTFMCILAVCGLVMVPAAALGASAAQIAYETPSSQVTGGNVPNITSATTTGEADGKPVVKSVALTTNKTESSGSTLPYTGFDAIILLVIVGVALGGAIILRILSTR